MFFQFEITINVLVSFEYIYFAQEETQQIKNELISCNLVRTVRFI